MMAWRTIVIFAIIKSVGCNGDVSREHTEATESGTASLPCNLTPLIPSDKVSVVQWYRGNEETPFYKYDLRGPRPQQWVEPALGDRFFFRKQDEERATLTISLTRLADEDVYHCLVDFSRSPLRKTHVNLTVIGEYPYSIQTKENVEYFQRGISYGNFYSFLFCHRNI